MSFEFGLNMFYSLYEKNDLVKGDEKTLFVETALIACLNY
jgi:hypothetical protein